jgi:cystathionine beta-lyase/cystathionine gamma-synthase
VVAKKIAVLEQTEEAMIFASGMAAISTAMYSCLKSGDHAVFSQGRLQQKSFPNQIVRYLWWYIQICCGILQPTQLHLHHSGKLRSKGL